MKPSQYIAELAKNNENMFFHEFFHLMHSKFYEDKDITFMKEFLELSQCEDLCTIPFEKLQEYAVNKPLSELKLEEEIDYELIDICEDRYIYHLTPSAFKRCILKHSNDATVYIEYYLLLEKIHQYYDRFLAMKATSE